MLANRDTSHSVRDAVEVVVANLEGARHAKAKASPFKSDVGTIYRLAAQPPSLLAIVGQGSYLNRFVASIPEEVDYDLRLLWSRLTMQIADGWVEWFTKRVRESAVIFYDNPTPRFPEAVSAALHQYPHLGILILMEQLTGEDTLRLGLRRAVG